MAAKSNRTQLCSIVTDTFPNLRTGAIKDFAKICNNESIQVKTTKTPYTFIINGWTFEFFSVDKETKGLGGRRDRLFINEANRVNWKIARQLIARTHEECIFDFNPVARFWAHEQFVEVGDGDFIKLTYKDNECLPQAEVDSIEKYAPWGTLPDENYWRVYGLGEIGFVEGQIFKHYNSWTTLPESEYQTAVGMDFGWEDPCSMVQVWIDHKQKRLFWKELFYGSHTKYKDVIAEAKTNGFNDNEMVICDHEPRDIMTLRELGVNAIEAIKGGLTSDIRLIKQYELFIHEYSVNLKREVDAYKYQEKKGVIIDYPDQSCEEHSIDSGRYASTWLMLWA